MHRYAACLRFYEIVPREEIEVVFREVYGSSQVCSISNVRRILCKKAAASSEVTVFNVILGIRYASEYCSVLSEDYLRCI